MHFKIGERVRLLHEAEEGVVTQIFSNGRLEILIDDFFEREVDPSEVVKIDAAETRYVRKPEPEKEAEPAWRDTPQLPASLAILRTPGKNFRFYLVNPTRDEILFSLYIRIRNQYHSINAGLAAPGEHRLCGEIDSNRFFLASKVLLRTLRHTHSEKAKIEEPFVLEISAKTELHGQEMVPLEELKGEGYRFVLEEVKPETHVSESSGKGTISADSFRKPPEIIDLHIAKLVKKPFGMSSDEMLQTQLEEFDRKLTDALMHNIRQVVFIHGIGDGTLKRQIHNRLAEYDFVHNFKLADPLKYGNGATMVELRLD